VGGNSVIVKAELGFVLVFLRSFWRYSEASGYRSMAPIVEVHIVPATSIPDTARWN
jgi:hypothetical protein